jgi:cell division ATPase FtsA
MPHIVEFAKDRLRLPVSIGQPVNLLGVVDHVDDSSYATVIGLILWVTHSGTHHGKNYFGGGVFGSIGAGFTGIAERISGTFRRFLP